MSASETRERAFEVAQAFAAIVANETKVHVDDGWADGGSLAAPKADAPPRQTEGHSKTDL